MKARLLIALAVILFAFAARMHRTEVLRTGPDVRPMSADVRPMSADAWYYLHRTVRTHRGLAPRPADKDAEALPSWEPGLSCPEGTAPPWPHGLNLLGALLTVPTLGTDASDAEIRTLASYLPPVIGALCCGLLALFGMATISTAAGALAGVLLALLPIHVWNTTYTTLDHHIFAALVPLLAAWAMWRGGRAGRLGPYALAGLVLGLGHWCWTETWFWEAALLGVGLLHALVGVSLKRRDRALAGLALMAGIAAVTAVPGIVTAPYFVHDRVAPHAPSRFTLWVDAGLAVAALTAWLVRRRDTIPILVAALVGGLAVAALALVDPGMREAYAATAGFAGRAGMVSLIDESRPLLARPFPQPLMLLSGAIVVAPALPLAFARLRPDTRWLLGAWFVLSGVLALMQSRFALVFALPFCLGLAALLVHGLPTSLVRRPGLLRAVAAIGACTMLLSAATRSYWSADKEVRWQFMGQLAERMPAPDAAGPEAPRCLLGPWNLGHELLLVGGQPVVAHNYTEHRDREAIRDVDRVLFGPPDDIPAVLEARRVRLLWIDARDRADVRAHMREIGLPADTDLRDTLWFKLAVGDQQAAKSLNLRRIWRSPLTVEAPLFGPEVRPLALPRDQLYIRTP